VRLITQTIIDGWLSDSSFVASITADNCSTAIAAARLMLEGDDGVLGTWLFDTLRGCLIRV